MKRFAFVLAAATLAAGCSVPYNSAAKLGVPVGQQDSSPSTLPTGDAVITPVAASKTATSTTASAAAKAVPSVSQAQASTAPDGMPFVPKSAADVQQAMQLLASGLQTTDGKAFNLFDTSNPPANAIVTPDPALQQAASSASGYSTQALPETTQAQADQTAYAWAPDAKQIYVGWGYPGRWAPLSMFGEARHVYYSISKQRLLYLDYDFFRFQQSRWESSNIVMKYAGKYVTYVLNEARGRFPYTGWMAFWQAVGAGYSYNARTNATIKAICIDPIFLGPQWVFFDGADRPSMIVDADSGQVTQSGLLMDIMRGISMVNP